ncbi:CD225/dispanin family protein [Sphingobacterium paludis]|uniref:Uncharacterized protein DUF4339 n=1 Tax=Sphingobacterium paludis TaxID=1476465 RepID=A0A4R7D2N5_9SPHI|nr:CD225/dispanin family protein [Sphingobacterium paludis]TDS13865.1 uncharacterized protein DUF4339 [Sphingobacterium paludis]
MQKFYYTDGTNTFGPLSLEELKGKGLTGDTYVWTEGLPSWVAARQMPELAPLLNDTNQPYYSGATQVPPQFGSSLPPNFNVPNTGRPPRTYLVESILATLFCCLPLGIPAIVYASRVEGKFYRGDYSGAEADSANAKKWLFINLGLSVGLWILYFLIFGFAMFGAMLGDFS